MKNVLVEVFGPDPPCWRCTAVKNAVEQVAKEIKDQGINVKIKRYNIASREVVSKYGVLFSPAMAVNGVVKTMGRIPSTEEILRIIQES